MKMFRIIYHDPTGEIMVQKQLDPIPEFCDVLERDLTFEQSQLAEKKWNDHFQAIDELSIERMRIFNQWKYTLPSSMLFMSGANIFQNNISITEKKINEWKVDVKMQHQILNARLKKIYKESIQYLEKVKI